MTPIDGHSFRKVKRTNGGAGRVMDVFPAAFPLCGLTLAVAGDGEAAEAKARLFDGSPAQVRRIPAAVSAVSAHYTGARLAFLALPAAKVETAAAAARAAGALVNAVDRPALCDFHTPALVDRGAVVAAIATAGSAPVLAAELRSEIEARWPQRLGALAQLIGVLRGEVRAALPDLSERRAWLRRALIDGPPGALALAGDAEGALVAARGALAAGRTESGQARVALLVPPAEPDLLSLRALRALGRADVLVIAPGVDPAVVALARRDAVRLHLDQMSPSALAERIAMTGPVVCIGPAQAFVSVAPMDQLP